MERLRRSWELGKASWGVLRSNPVLLLFPLVSGLVALVVFAVIAGVGLALVPGLRDVDALGDAAGTPGAYAALFVFYLVGYTIIIFFNSALTGAALIDLEGGVPTFQDGMRIATERWRSIVGFALVSATVGVALTALRKRGGIAGLIASWIGNIAWSLATYFVIPVLVVQRVGPVDAIKESAKLLRRTWGEQLAGQAGIGIFSFLIVLAALVPSIAIVGLAAATGALALIVIAVVIAVALVVLAIAVTSAMGQIFTAALYRYAMQGAVSPGYEAEALRGAFQPKG